MKDLLIIFTRNPQLGKCKTRLAATVGDQAALAIYVYLIKHTFSITQNLRVDKQVYYTEEVGENDLWDPSLFEKKMQKGSDLGARMYHAFEEGFKAGYERIVLIGSDLYDLTTQDIERAFTALETTDFVMGPATDGGYYLIGMRTLEKEIFENKMWGTSTVLQETLRNLKHKSISLLPERNDVDVYEDIEHIEAFQKFLIHIK